jgi:hypothetical protein
MVEILKTTDPIRLHFLKTLLEEAEIPAVVFGSGVYANVLPSRLMVPEDDADLARRLIAEAERDL